MVCFKCRGPLASADSHWCLAPSCLPFGPLGPISCRTDPLAGPERFGQASPFSHGHIPQPRVGSLLPRILQAQGHAGYLDSRWVRGSLLMLPIEHAVVWPAWRRNGYHHALFVIVGVCVTLIHPHPVFVLRSLWKPRNGEAGQSQGPQGIGEWMAENLSLEGGLCIRLGPSPLAHVHFPSDFTYKTQIQRLNY